MCTHNCRQAITQQKINRSSARWEMCNERSYWSIYLGIRGILKLTCRMLNVDLKSTFFGKTFKNVCFFLYTISREIIQTLHKFVHFSKLEARLKSTFKQNTENIKLNYFSSIFFVFLFCCLCYIYLLCLLWAQTVWRKSWFYVWLMRKWKWKWEKRKKTYRWSTILNYHHSDSQEIYLQVDDSCFMFQHLSPCHSTLYKLFMF